VQILLTQKDNPQYWPLHNELKLKFIGILNGIDNPNRNRKILHTFRFFMFNKITKRRTEFIFILDEV